MFTPMFLMPGREESLAIGQVKLTVYMDGQYTGRLIFDGSGFSGGSHTFCPRVAHKNSGQNNTHPIETGSLSYPIAGFDGWIGPDDQPYQNVTVPGSFIWQPRILHDYPLSGSKGVFAIDLHHSPTREGAVDLAVIPKTGTNPDFVPQFIFSRAPAIATFQNLGFITISREVIPYADINPAARWLAMTVELS